MRILVSGLAQPACREILGDLESEGHTLRWCLPAEFTKCLAKPAGDADADRLVWLYRAPWSPAAFADVGDATPNPGSALTAWLHDNRAVLNARAQAGSALLLTNADRVQAVDLKAEIKQPGSAPPAPGSDEAAASTQDASALAKLFELVAPRCWDVFEALEAAAWTSGDTPWFRGMHDPDESDLHALLQSVFDGRALPQVRSGLAEVEKELDDARKEGELLLIQLHQVQEELEQYYLKGLDSGKRLDQAQKEIKALKLKLRQMQAELKQAQAPATAAALVKVNGTGKSLQGWRKGTRIVPAPLRRAVSRSLEQRRQQSERLRLVQSGWFNPEWYLDTYPDVREAKADPVTHYLETGWKENRNPCAGFDTAYYLRTYPDVKASGINPLWHYIEHGSKEGRLPRKP